MKHRNGLQNFLFLPILPIVFFISGCSSSIGESFEDVDAIGMSETWRSWVVVGRFGPEGPFEVVDIKECGVSEACTFSHRSQGHTYDKFVGYKLTVLRLEGPNDKVSHVVLRSKEKFDG